MADGSSPRLQRITDYPALLNEAWAQAHAHREANAPTVISTFAGCGGSSLGYHMAGFRELLAVEWEQNAADTFRLNFPHVPLYHGDIAKLSVDECLRLANIAPGELDVFDGSPPCQGFSTAGKREIALGALHPTRDFTLVKDTAQGFLQAAACDHIVGGVTNIGSGFEISILETARLIADVMGQSITFHQDPQRVTGLAPAAGLCLVEVKY